MTHVAILGAVECVLMLHYIVHMPIARVHVFRMNIYI